MKKILLSLFVALIATTAIQAQQISVVSPGGDTTLYRTLQEAIKGAAPESVIYLPGGSFNGNDTITKKLTIIGIGNKIKTDNPDGHTYINGSVYFYPGSDGSALMGCYVDRYVIIGKKVAGDNNCVNDILLRYNRIYNVSLLKTNSGVTINQNYIGEKIYCGDNNVYNNHGASITNNVVYAVEGICDAIISNNVIFGGGNVGGTCYRSLFRDNVILNSLFNSHLSDYSGNMARFAYGDDCIVLGDDVSLNDVFVRYESNNVFNSDFHFKGDYKQYEGKIGIYSGTGFNDKQMAPVPYIVAKRIDEQTDAYGKLNVKIRVNAGGGIE